MSCRYLIIGPLFLADRRSGVVVQGRRTGAARQTGMNTLNFGLHVGHLCLRVKLELIGCLTQLYQTKQMTMIKPSDGIGLLPMSTNDHRFPNYIRSTVSICYQFWLITRYLLKWSSWLGGWLPIFALLIT